MKRLIRKILREEIEKSDKHYRILDKISDHVEIPYFESMEGLTIYDKDDQLYILKKILGNGITIKGERVYVSGTVYSIFNENGKIIYTEDTKPHKGFRNNYRHQHWKKYEYNDRGNMVYKEISDGGWVKWEYDDNGNEIYYENSSGGWWKREYDNRGNMIYYENSGGEITDRR